MEGQAVIEAVAGQGNEVAHGDGGRVAVQLHGDGAVVLDGDVGVVGAGHPDLLAGRGLQAGLVLLVEEEGGHQGEQDDDGGKSQLDLSGQALGLRVVRQNNLPF